VKVLIVGAGGVGAAIAAIAARRTVFSEVVLADVDAGRARRAAEQANRRAHRDGVVRSVRVDATDRSALAQLIVETSVDVVMNACDPRFNPPIFDTAFATGRTYIDMAMHLSEPHPQQPFELVGKPLGEAQWAAAGEWESRGQLALLGMGVESGLSDVFARHAADTMFSRIDEIGVRDGSDITVEGYEFAPSFSIWTVIEECLNPPLIWEKERGWFTTAPFSEPEVFTFPEGIGPIECVNVEHEEVLMMPRYLDVGRVTFKYGLGEEFIDILETLHLLGLDNKNPIKVGGAVVSPRDVVAACLPNPAELGPRMKGRTCAGSWVRGLGTSGAPRSTYLYHVVDNEWSMREWGHQAVVWQTAINPVIAMELMALGVWEAAGVHGPERFDAAPYLDLLVEYGSPWSVMELDPSTAG
jgi:saccharopine dehydrogenase (NAD+, L-lysine forming)